MAIKDLTSNRFIRSLQQRTARRRGEGRKRTRTVALIVLALSLLIVLALPSLICNTTLGKTMVVHWAEGYKWQMKVRSIQFGWITPLKLSGLTLDGESGNTHAEAASVETELTLLQMLQGFSELGHIRLDGLSVDFVIADGRTSLENDLEQFLEPSSDAGWTAGTIEIRDAHIRIGDASTKQVWEASQLQAKIVRSGRTLQWDSTAVLTDPSGANGALQMACTVPMAAGEESEKWDADLQLNSVPLYVVDLVKRRFPESAQALPDSLLGDASGAVVLSARADGGVDASFSNVEVRQLSASDRRLGDRVWANQLATLSGQLSYTGHSVVGKQLKATTDFGGATVSGTFSTSAFGATPLAWLEATDGTAVLEVDLPALNRSAPGLIPMRSGAEILSGKVRADVVSGWGSDQVYRSNWNVRCDPLRAQAGGRAVTVEPVEAKATWRLDHGRVSAEEIRLRSGFGTASGHGDLRSGRGDFDVDFGRLTAILRPIVELPETSFEGVASGGIDWTTSADGRWQLKGDVTAQDVVIALPGGNALRPGALTSEVEAAGIWNRDTLTRLTSARASIQQQQKQHWEATLSEVVEQPDSRAFFPLHVTGSGDLRALSQLVGPWLPADLHSLDGRFEMTAEAGASLDRVQLRNGQLKLQEPRVGWQQYLAQQPFLNLDFVGQWNWPSGLLKAQKLTIAGEAVSMALEGSSSEEATDLFVSWRANLQRLQRSVNTLPPSRRSAESRLAASDNQGWLWQGACEGRAKLKARDAIWEIDTDASADNLALLQPPQSSTASDFVGPSRPGQQTAKTPRVVWSEPQASMRGIVRYDARSGGAIADAVHVSSNWLSTNLSGKVIWNEATGQVELEGPSEISMDMVAKRLSELVGHPMELTGRQSTPLKIMIDRRRDGSLAMDLRTTLGWERGRISGVNLGKSTVPVRLTETAVYVQPSVVPIGTGRLNLAGEVHYRPGPLWFEQRPGPFAEDIRLTPEMTKSWLKYLAPLAADTAEIAGTFSVDLDEAVVVVDEMERSRVSGRMKIQGAQLDAGPLAQQLFETIDIVKSLARGLQGPSQPSASRRLVTMEPQTVDFALQNGIIRHQRLFMTIDNARVVTSGAVATNGQLDLLAQIPLQQSWLGTDLQALTGQNISLPIRGSLSNPRLDASGVTQMVRQVGTQAVRQTAENALQEQLNRGMQKIFGR